MQPTEEQLLTAANALRPRTICVYLLQDVSYWEKDFPPGHAVEFQTWLAAKLEQVPEEHRAAVEMAWEGNEEGTQLSVFYKRPETAEEFAARVRALASEKLRQERLEQLQYERLRKKFDPQQKDHS